MSIDAKLAELDITLPKTPSPIGNYIGGVVTGNLLFMSGVGPRKPDGGAVTGKVGADLTTEDILSMAKGAFVRPQYAGQYEVGDR